MQDHRQPGVACQLQLGAVEALLARAVAALRQRGRPVLAGPQWGAALGVPQAILDQRITSGKIIRAALDRTGHSATAAARLLGSTRET